MENIPLQQVVSHGHTLDRTGSSTTARDEYAGDYKPEVQQEKSGLFHRHTRGRRKLKKVSSKGAGTGVKGYDGEEDTITAMGRFYTKFMNFSIVTRYFVYVAPVGLAIAVPIVVGATAAKHAEIGGVKIVWFFTWVEIGESDPSPGLCNVSEVTDMLGSLVRSLDRQDCGSLLAFALPVLRRSRQLRYAKVLAHPQGPQHANLLLPMGAGSPDDLHSRHDQESIHS